MCEMQVWYFVLAAADAPPRVYEWADKGHKQELKLTSEWIAGKSSDAWVLMDGRQKDPTHFLDKVFNSYSIFL